MVSGAEDQWNISITYGVFWRTKRNLFESDCENEAADFSIFIVITFLEEVCLAKFSSFLIEMVSTTRANPQDVSKKHGREICLSRWTAEWRMKRSSSRKASTQPNAEHISMQDWTLVKELSEAVSWSGLQQRIWQQPWENREWQISEEWPLEKAEIKSRTTPRSWHLINSIFLRKWKSVIVSRCLYNKSHYHSAALKVKKYGLQRECQTCAQCNEKDLDHIVEDCLKKIRYPYCRQDNKADSRSYNVYRKAKEILEV